MKIPHYKQKVGEYLDQLLSISSTYCGDNTPLPENASAELSQRMDKAKNVCSERMQAFRPRIMLYGVYNSGKSTLLNALLGEERAEMGDIPKTAVSTSYNWHGHEIVDTPGIDAPIEHEMISRETLRSSQIILFVMSAKGSFEHKKIYEAMRDVVDQGKNLIIVLNNKDDEHSVEGLADIKDRIQKILEEQGLTRRQAAAFKLMLVNAQYALEGRLGNDKNLIEYSGINELEEILHTEINRTDGYALVKDSLKYILTEYEYMLSLLKEHINNNNEDQIGAFYSLREQYQNFLTKLENIIDAESASLTDEIRHCFPAPGSQMSEEAIKNSVNKLLEECLQIIQGQVGAESEKFLAILAKQGLKILNSGEEGLEYKAELENYGELLEALKKHEQDGVNTPAFHYKEDTDFIDTLDKTANVLAGIPLLKLPLPLPIPPIVLGAIFTGIKVITSIFGKSAAEKASERMEAQIAYERERAERQARAEERQREDIKSYAIDIKSKFIRGIKTALRENMDKKFRPVFDALEKQCASTSRLSEKIKIDCSQLLDKKREIEVLLSGLG